MKTLLVDDHPLFREGLALLMTQAFPHLKIHQAGGIAEALASIAAEGDFGLVLLDLGLPDSAGMQGLRRLREQAPEVTVVVLSAEETSDTVLAAIDEGAAGFIPKTSRLKAMQAALRVVLDGGVYLPDAVLQRGTLPALSPEPADANQSLGLSPRQLDVLKLLIEGKPNKLICRDLSLSESTVKTHLAAIFRKLDASSRTQAVVAAARLGLRLNAHLAI